MGFSLKKLGRFIDPTSKTSPLGGLVRKGLDAGGSVFGLPPGVISGGLETMGARGPRPLAPIPPTPPAALGFLPGPPGPPGTPAASTLKDMFSKTSTWLGLAAVVGLVLLLVVRRK